MAQSHPHSPARKTGPVLPDMGMCPKILGFWVLDGDMGTFSLDLGTFEVSGKIYNFNSENYK